jgi:hypothetical protein
MRPIDISNWHFGQIIRRNWAIELIPENRREHNTLNHRQKPVEVAVIEPTWIIELCLAGQY